MRRDNRVAALLLSLAFVVPALAADKNNKKDAPARDPSNEATVQDYRALGSTLVGTLETVGADQSIVLRVEYEIAEPN